MDPITVIRSRTVVMPSTNIDTDQIVPARFLTTTTKEGLGKQLFADWRYDAAGQPKPDFILNRPEAAGCRVLVAGRNIGCGSQRTRGCHNRCWLHTLYICILCDAIAVFNCDNFNHHSDLASYFKVGIGWKA